MPAPDMAAPERTVQCSLAYARPTDADTAISRGTEAARRLIAGGSLTDWLDVAAALAEGAKLAEAQAGQAKGKAYAQAFASWLKDHPELRAVGGPERAAAIWALKDENWSGVERYLNSLTTDELLRTNMRAIKRRLGPPPRPRKPKPASELETVRREKVALEAALADTEDRFAASETDALRFSFAEAPESFAALIVRRNYTWAKRLHDTLDDILKRWVKRHQADEADMRPTL